MNELDRRKLKLLVHLAKVDGKFEKSEHKLLKQFVREKRLSQSMLKGEHDPFPIDHHMWGTDCKIELLYWAIRLIQADDVIHEQELKFGRDVAMKLNFKEDVVSYFAYKPMIDYDSFQSVVRKEWMKA